MFNDLIRDKNTVYWTFKTWIKNFEDVDLPIGDLAGDISSDSDFPEDDIFSEIYDHLRSKHASSPVIDTFVCAWNYYLASNATPDGLLKLYNETSSHKGSE